MKSLKKCLLFFFGAIIIIVLSYSIFRELNYNNSVYSAMFHRNLTHDQVLEFSGNSNWFMGKLEIVVRDNSDLLFYFCNRKWYSEKSSQYQSKPLLAKYLKKLKTKVITYKTNKINGQLLQHVPSENLIYLTFTGDW
jgi:hypothetical protein